MTKTLLIVDDLKANHALIKQNLYGRSYRILSAYDGEEGLREIEKEQPDLVLLDMRMPKVDGRDVLRTLGTAYQKPVIVFTGEPLTIEDFEEYPYVVAVFDKNASGEKIATAINGLIGDVEPTGEM